MQYVALSFLESLQKILGDIFDKVLSPVLRDVFNIIVNTIGAMIQEVLSGLLLQFFITILKLIAWIEDIFGVFAGINAVYYGENLSQQDTLLGYFFQLSQFQRAFLTITLISLALAFLTTMWAVGKSISDMTFENQHPISYVLKHALRAALIFAIIPFSCLFALKLADQVVLSVNERVMVTTEGDAATSITDILFISCVSEAEKAEGITSKYVSGHKYENLEQVKKDFDLTKINYILAYLSAGLTAIILLIAIIQSIRRIFEVMMLYLVAPFFVALIPQDEGAKFKEWKNRFVGMVFSSLGPVIMMKLYLIIVPSVAVGNTIQFTGATWMGSYIRLFLVIGGAWAVYKSQFLVMQLIDPNNSAAENAQLLSGIGRKISSAVGRKK